MIPLLRRFAVTLVGAALLLAGAAMMVLPGPGVLTLVAGLGVLATEYVWARRLLARTRQQARLAQQAAVTTPGRTAVSLVLALCLAVLGITMTVLPDVAWPVLPGLLDLLWGPVTAGFLVVAGVVLATTTVVAFRHARHQGAPGPSR